MEFNLCNMSRLSRRIKKLALLEHKLEEKTIQLANQEQHDDGKKRVSELFHSVGTVTRWRARTKAKDLLAVPISGNHTLIRRKSAGLRQVLSANLQRRIKQGLGADINLAPLFLGLLNPYKKPKIPPLDRFRNYAKLALICIRLCKYSHENVAASQDEYLSIIQITEDFVPIIEQDEMFFDARIYRASKEQRLPVEARKILKRDPRYRTEKEIDYLHVVLRSIKAFSDYPTKMQRQLCVVGWYEAYEPKRAIVRQGAPPHAFYFILSGKVIVTTFDKKSGGTTFLVALYKGMSFGELAVINKSKRQATVSTGAITELLCISAKDFVEIFMAGGLKSVTDRDQNSFIRSIPFLKHWPVECLASNPQACLFHFFSRGTVIVRDSNHSDWIYVVKSGSLSVLKKLVEVHPRAGKKQSDSDSESEDEEIKKLPIYQSFGTWNHKIKRKKRRHEEDKEVYRNQMEMEKRLEQTLPGFHNNQERLGVIDYDEIIQEHKSRVLPTRRMSIATGLLPKITVQEVPELEAINDKENETQNEDDKTVRLPKIRRTSKGVYLATETTKGRSSRKQAIQEELFQKQMEYEKRMHQELSNTYGRKTIANELDNKPIRDFTLTEKDIRPMFVQVQILERGQYFGLTKHVFPEQAGTYSLVSNGAECIMISKKFFFEKANEAVLHNLREVETLLPPEEELQGGLQEYVDWKAYRAKVYNRLVKNKLNRNIRQRQFPTQFSGQYCFRTGPLAR